MKREPFYSCPECKIGILHPHQAFLFTVQDGQPICVPDFPAWVCDLCGQRNYDSTALAELQAMLETDRRARRKQHRPKASVDHDHPLTSGDPLRQP